MKKQIDIASYYGQAQAKHDELAMSARGYAALPVFAFHFTLSEIYGGLINILEAGDSLTLADAINSSVGGVIASWEAFTQKSPSELISDLKQIPNQLDKITNHDGTIQSHEEDGNNWWSFRDKEFLMYWTVNDEAIDKSVKIFLGKPDLSIPRENNPYAIKSNDIPLHNRFMGKEYECFEVSATQLGKLPLVGESTWSVHTVSQDEEFKELPKYGEVSELSPKEWIQELKFHLPTNIQTAFKAL